MKKNKNCKFKNIIFREFEGLFSYKRVASEDIPEGMTSYQLRHGNDWGIPETIEPFVGSDFYGTILLEGKLEFPDKNDPYLKLTNEEKNDILCLDND